MKLILYESLSRCRQRCVFSALCSHMRLHLYSQHVWYQRLHLPIGKNKKNHQGNSLVMKSKLLLSKRVKHRELCHFDIILSEEGG